MKYPDFETDIALEVAQKLDLNSLCRNSKLDGGVEKRVLEVKDKATSEQIGKPIGTYVVYDRYNGNVLDKSFRTHMTHYLAKSIEALSFPNAVKGRCVLVAGLGNADVAADALGALTIGKLNTTRITASGAETKSKIRLCAVATGVGRVTGIDAAETVKALVRETDASMVVAVDALATSSAKRLASSFQLSNAGITPGGGVNRDRQRLDRNNIGVPVVSIGVPTVVVVRTAFRTLLETYSRDEIDCNRFNTALDEMRLLNMTLAPKETALTNDILSSIISDALNALFSV